MHPPMIGGQRDLTCREPIDTFGRESERLVWRPHGPAMGLGIARDLQRISAEITSAEQVVAKLLWGAA
jgi:hypothetical protein